MPFLEQPIAATPEEKAALYRRLRNSVVSEGNEPMITAYFAKVKAPVARDNSPLIGEELSRWEYFQRTILYEQITKVIPDAKTILILQDDQKKPGMMVAHFNRDAVQLFQDFCAAQAELTQPQKRVTTPEQAPTAVETKWTSRTQPSSGPAKVTR